MKRIALVSIVAVLGYGVIGRAEEVARARRLSREQQLIVACFQLEVDRVKELLAAGASVNAVMGEHDSELFEDKWMLGYPLASPKWTPLLAVANSNREPDPERETENTTEGRRRALIATKAKLNDHDGYGATALAAAVYNRYEDLALLLIEAGAEVNTKTGIYIDGAGDITPLHRATRDPKVVKALLAHGAKVDARDSTGETPLHWAALDANAESIRLLIAAGADVNAKSKEGRLPRDWALERDILNMLKESTAK